MPVCSKRLPSLGLIVTAPLTDSPSIYSGAFSRRFLSSRMSTMDRSSPSSNTMSMSTGVAKKYDMVCVCMSLRESGSGSARGVDAIASVVRRRPPSGSRIVALSVSFRYYAAEDARYQSKHGGRSGFHQKELAPRGRRNLMTQPGKNNGRSPREEHRTDSGERGPGTGDE